MATRLYQAMVWWNNHYCDEINVPARHLDTLTKQGFLSYSKEGQVYLNRKGKRYFNDWYNKIGYILEKDF